MEKLYAEGKARSIGVSNWTIKGLETLLGYCSVKPAVNQVEIHPFLSNSKLLEYCFSKDILPVAYSPLGSQNQVPATGERVTTNPELNALADKLGVTLAQILIAWGIKRGYVVLPKSSDPSRIKSNFQLISLRDDDFAAVNKVAEGRHTRFVNLKDLFGIDIWADEVASH